MGLFIGLFKKIIYVSIYVYIHGVYSWVIHLNILDISYK